MEGGSRRYDGQYDGRGGNLSSWEGMGWQKVALKSGVLANAEVVAPES